MILVVITTLAIWLVSGTKIMGPFSLWHIALGLTLFAIFINKNRAITLAKVVIFNKAFIIIALLIPLYMLLRDSFEGSYGELYRSNILRGVGGFLYALCLAVYTNSEKKRNTIYGVLLLVFSVHSVVGILQYLYPETYYEIPEMLSKNLKNTTYVYGGRVRGLFVNVHIYGQCMLGLFTVFLAVIFFDKKEKKGFLSPDRYTVYVLIAGTIAIMLTYLRAAYIAIVVSGMIVFALMIRERRRKAINTITFILFFAFVGGVGIWIGLFQAEVAERLSSKYLSSGDIMRYDSFKVAVRVFNENTLFGSGGISNIFIMGVHNIILSVMAYYGLVGLVLYGMFYASLLVSIYYVHPKYQHYKVGLFLWFVTYILYGMGHTGSFWIGGGLHEWTFVGVILGFGTQLNDRRSGVDHCQTEEVKQKVIRV